MDFSGLTVLCVGDIMLDQFVYGKMERISPEAPVPVVRRSHMREMLGGAGNVANNIAALGGHTVLTGLIGRDGPGALVSQRLAELPGATANLVESATRPTISKTRYIAANQQVMRIDDESQAPLSAEEEAALAAAALPWIDRVQAVILSDYAKGVLSPTLVATLIAASVKAGIPVFVDPKAADFSRYRGATCIKPNLKELALAAGEPVDSEAAVVSAARAIMARTGTQSILATRSERGMMLVTADEVHTVPGRAREVFDVSGAGDTVIATLALCHASGRSLVQSMHIANAAAAVVVSKLGTATASMPEVLRELALDDAATGMPVLPGLRSVDEARDLVAKWKQQGLSIGFTNGCFDILHTGHIASLSHARAACDRLIVALNTDESVSRLKGPSRPINALELRAKVMAALRDVDCVVSFGDPTPIELIRTLMPDVLVKGADYTPDGVVGGDIVIAAGGRVVLAPFVAGQSTTRLVAQIQEDATPARAIEEVGSV